MFHQFLLSLIESKCSPCSCLSHPPLCERSASMRIEWVIPIFMSYQGRNYLKAWVTKASLIRYKLLYFFTTDEENTQDAGGEHQKALKKRSSKLAHRASSLDLLPDLFSLADGSFVFKILCEHEQVCYWSVVWIHMYFVEVQADACTFQWSRSYVSFWCCYFICYFSI